MTTIPAEKLDKLVSRWETVQSALAAGADQEIYVKLSREFSELDPIVATINALRTAARERADLQQLIDDPASGKDMTALALEEIGPLDEKIEALEHQLKVQLLPKDAADEKNVDPRNPRRHRRRGGGAVRRRSLPHVQRYADTQRLEGRDPLGERLRDRRLQGNHRLRSPARASTRTSSSSAACTACSACRRPRRRAASTPRPRRWRCCPRRKRSTSRSTRRTCASTCSAVERPRRPVGQHDRLGRAHHAPADGPRRQLPGREVAAQEQGEGDEGPARAPLRASSARSWSAERSADRRSQVGSGDRSRAHPHLQFSAGTA